MHQLVRTDGTFELLVVPYLFEEDRELLEEGVFEVGVEQKELSEGGDGVEELECGVEIVGFFEIVDADDAGYVLLAVDVVLGLEVV